MKTLEGYRNEAQYCRHMLKNLGTGRKTKEQYQDQLRRAEANIKALEG